MLINIKGLFSVLAIITKRCKLLVIFHGAFLQCLFWLLFRLKLLAFASLERTAADDGDLLWQHRALCVLVWYHDILDGQVLPLLRQDISMRL